MPNIYENYFLGYLNFTKVILKGLVQGKMYIYIYIYLSDRICAYHVECPGFHPQFQK